MRSNSFVCMGCTIVVFNKRSVTALFVYILLKLLLF